MADITPRNTKAGTVYEARWPDPEKPGKYRTKRFDRRKDAAAHLQDLPKYLAAQAAERALNSSPTIGQTLDTWLRTADTTGIDGNDPVQAETYRHYTVEANHLKKLYLEDESSDPPVRTKVADLRIGTLTPPVIMRIRQALLMAMSRKNARRCFSRLRLALNEARRQGLLSTNPAEGISITLGSRHKANIEIPEEHEASALLQAVTAMAAESDRWRRYALMVKILMFTGMRPSELRGLPRKAISKDFPMISITQKADERCVIGSPKTEAAKRVIRIQTDLWHEILEWMEGIPPAAETLLFAHKGGRAEPHISIIKNMWWPAQKRAGLTNDNGEPRYILYSLRHFYASTEIAMGANQKELQEAMGHEEISTTLDVYGKLFSTRNGGGQAARAEMRAKRLAGELPEEESAVITFRRSS